MDTKETTVDRFRANVAFRLLSQEVVNFPFQDSRSRLIGARASIWELTVTEAGEQLTCYAGFDGPGIRYQAEVHATRNQQLYGASHRRPDFATLDEAKAYIQERLAASLKAAEKKARK